MVTTLQEAARKALACLELYDHEDLASCEARHELRTALAQLEKIAATEPAKIERKIYKDTPEYRSYLDARFTPDQWGGSFELDGHRWAYHWTSFDDAGDFDLIYRWVEPKHSPMPAQGVEACIINLPEPVAWFANYGGNVYTEAQLKQAVRDALDAQGVEDAARYRWLRDYLISPSTHFDDLIVSADKADTLDSVIDAARAKGAKQ